MHARASLALLLVAALAGCADLPCAGQVTAQAVPGRAIAVTWGAVANATSYLVLRATDDGPLEAVAEVDAGQGRYLDANVTAGHTYTYLVATEEHAPLDGCSSARAAVADASVPFLAGPGLALALGGSLLGSFLLLRRRR